MLALLFAGTGSFSQEINVISYNIRYDNPGDGENAWPNRKEMVGQLLKFHEADIFGLQEALIGQIEDISRALPEFKWIGAGREDGKREGEYSPVFYNSEKFNLIKKGWFWLAEESDKPVLGWDAACKRICTWGIFQNKKSGKEFMALNTHFDHEGIVAQQRSAALILQKIEEINTGKRPLILTGDFNLLPDSEPIQYIKKKLSDSKEVSEQAPYGPEGTTNSFDFNSPLVRRIDYAFVNDQVKVKKYAVLSDSKNKRYPSDHLPIFVTVKF